MLQELIDWSMPLTRWLCSFLLSLHGVYRNSISDCVPQRDWLLYYERIADWSEYSAGTESVLSPTEMECIRGAHSRLHRGTGGVVVSCKIPILATRVRFPVGALIIPLFFFYRKLLLSRVKSISAPLLDVNVLRNSIAKSGRRHRDRPKHLVFFRKRLAHSQTDA